MEIPQQVQYEPPQVLTKQNVIYWSEHYKRLEGCKEGKAIKTKARKFLELNCIAYDPEGEKYGYEKGDYENHKFICLPIKGYNKTTYRMWWSKEIQDFVCSCQFNQKVKMPCSHITALWLWIKILTWNKKNKERNHE